MASHLKDSLIKNRIFASKRMKMDSESTPKDHVALKRNRIAARISELIRARGLSQRAFARLIGMQESYISKILSGEANLSLSTICAIEDALNQTIIEIRLERPPTGGSTQKTEAADAAIFFLR